MSTQKILTLLLNTGKHLILADFSKVYLQSPDTAFDNDDNTQVKTLFNVVIYSILNTLQGQIWSKNEHK